MQTLLGDLGHFLIISAFSTAIGASISYYRSIVTKTQLHRSKYITDARSFFVLHIIAIWASVAVLFYLIFNDKIKKI